MQTLTSGFHFHRCKMSQTLISQIHNISIFPLYKLSLPPFHSFPLYAYAISVTTLTTAVSQPPSSTFPFTIIRFFDRRFWSSSSTAVVLFVGQRLRPFVSVCVSSFSTAIDDDVCCEFADLFDEHR